jgi:hypothetical protein
MSTKPETLLIMKTKYMFALGLVGIGTMLATPAQAGFSIGFSLGIPFLSPPVVAYPAPVAVAPPPVATCAPPVYYAPAPVQYYAPPVVVVPPPCYPAYGTVVWGYPGHGYGRGHSHGHGYSHGWHH